MNVTTAQHVAASFLAVMFAVGCRQAPQPPVVTDDARSPSGLTASDRVLFAAAKIALPPAGIAPGDLPDPTSPGAQILAKYCAQCHSLPAPSMHGVVDWPGVVRRMWLRMEWLPDSLGIRVPTMGERYTMLDYLTANALTVSGSNLPAGPGREVFALICSRCHALPDPRIHSKEDWPTVFFRMERNMERMSVALPDPSQTGDILVYLGTAATRRRAP